MSHDHDPWGKCEGEITVSSTGIEFKSDKKEHNFDWEWPDIQSVDRKSVSEFTLLSYQDQKWMLGRDRPFDFTVIEGQGLTDEVFDLISAKLKTPVVDRIVSQVGKGPL